MAITKNVSNLWFLRFITCQGSLPALAQLSQEEIHKIPGVGCKYGGLIREWQRAAKFSHEVDYVRDMIVSDASRILELIGQIASLEEAIKSLAQESSIARRLGSIPGFGKTSTAELAGEIGTFKRFESEASLALYLGMCPLTSQSGAQSR